MNDHMLDVYRCADRVEAETIRIRLAASGITAFVVGDDAVRSMAISGGGVNKAIVTVQVTVEDHDRAKRILDEDRQRSLSLGSWACEGCSEINAATFDICWKCENARSDFDPQSPGILR